MKSFTQWKSTQNREMYQKLLENQNILSSEITELKRAMDHQRALTQKEFALLRDEIQPFKISIKTPIDSNGVQNLIVNNRYTEIFELQKKGLSAEQIAAKLDKGLGEVEFILQLAVQSSH